MMFCGVPYLIGYLTLSYAHYTSTATLFTALLMTGRLISGIGMGWASAVAPVSPQLIRLTNCVHVCIYRTAANIRFSRIDLQPGKFCTREFLSNFAHYA